MFIQGAVQLDSMHLLFLQFNSWMENVNEFVDEDENSLSYSSIV